MESTNIQQEHHQFQDYLSVPSSLASSCLSTATNHHAFFLNNSNNIHASCGDHQPSPNTSFNSNNSMIQDQGFSLSNTNINIIQSPYHHDINHNHYLNPNLIKEESSTSSDHSDNNNNNINNTNNNSSFQSEMLLLNTTLSPTYKNHMLQPSLFQPNLHEFQDNIHNNDLTSSQSKGVTKFSQIFPSVNISKLTSSSMEVSNGVHGGLDSFGTTAFSSGGSINQPAAASSNHLLELFKGGGEDHGSPQYDGIRLCKSSNNLSSFDNNGVLESQRPSSYIVVPNLSHQTASKKQRFESRASCPPFKVRKEKLGDRVSALQQLVAPFGKTDTASVLMEAIGYIKFLQSQVETLSVPYMKLASRNGSSNNKQRVTNELSENGDQIQDLRSRGLCLVPLSCMSYITSDPGINGVSWPHPYNFDPGF